jgi:threonine/homoserine/homoserine lactone efflux protein
MLGTINLASFVITGIGLNVYPGADTMYIMGRSLSQGRKAGIVSVCGISAGALCHTLCAGIGLSSILLASPRAFQLLKFIGSIYLVYLGIKCIFNRMRAADKFSESYLARQDNYQIFKQGFLTNIFNPKVALFFLSFLPQFVDPIHNYGFFSFLFLGSIFLTTGTLWCFFIAWFSSRLSHIIRKNDRAVYYLEKITGVLYILIGLLIYF